VTEAVHSGGMTRIISFFGFTFNAVTGQDEWDVAIRRCGDDMKGVRHVCIRTARFGRRNGVKRSMTSVCRAIQWSMVSGGVEIVVLVARTKQLLFSPIPRFSLGPSSRLISDE